MKPVLLLFFFYCYGDHPDLHSFPTRRSSDLGKKFRVGIKSNISTNRNNLISGVDRCIRLFLLVLILRSEERFSRNAETDLVCRLLLEKKNRQGGPRVAPRPQHKRPAGEEPTC